MKNLFNSITDVVTTVTTTTTIKVHFQAETSHESPLTKRVILELTATTILVLGKQVFSSWQRLICEVGRTAVINTTVINNRNQCEIYQPAIRK